MGSFAEGLLVLRVQHEARGHYAPIADYVTTLLDEFELVHRLLPGRLRVSHLHWGSGTSTALEADNLARVTTALRRYVDITDDAELAIESDPRTLTTAMAECIGALGFTRASFGVQEFDPAVQRVINRISLSTWSSAR